MLHNGMTGERNVAILACVVNTATLHLDGDNVGGPSIVFATGLRIETETTHCWNSLSHSQFRNYTTSGAERSQPAPSFTQIYTYKDT